MLHDEARIISGMYSSLKARYRESGLSAYLKRKIWIDPFDADIFEYDLESESSDHLLSLLANAEKLLNVYLSSPELMVHAEDQINMGMAIRERISTDVQGDPYSIPGENRMINASADALRLKVELSKN